MKVILFGATGMVGQGVLLECLDDDRVESVLAPVRSTTGVEHAKLTELEHEDFFDYTGIEDRLGGYDACFFCLGVSAAGMKEDEYDRITRQLTVAAAETLVRVNPSMTFCYVSGAGTDSSEKGRSMWARVKGRTENELLALPFAASYMFRPAFIQPKRGIKSKTRLYRAFYAVSTPLFPVLKGVAGKWVTTTVRVGRAMIHVGLHGAETNILENHEIDALADATA